MKWGQAERNSKGADGSQSTKKKLVFLKMNNYLFILVLAALGLHCCMGFSQLRQVGTTLVVVHGLLIAVASLVSEHRP